MPDFENPQYLYLLSIIPFITFLFAIDRIRRRKALKLFYSSPNFAKQLNNYSKFKTYLKFVLKMCALALLIVALANPRAGKKLKEAKREGIDIVLALDISYSMKAEDLKPSRLERAKQAISRLLDKLQSDRVGLIVFAGSAKVMFPLTTDYSAAKMFLSVIDPEFVSEQGTAIGDAMDIAVQKFKTEEKQKKALIIISDGENHEDDAVEAAKKAAEKGFVVYTIGMGSPDGAPIPLSSGGDVRGYLKDEDGKTVVSKLNADALQEIAIAGGGSFIRTYQSEPDLQELINKIDKMEKKQFEAKKFSEYDSKYQYFAFASLILFAIETFISKYKGIFLKKMNIFGDDSK
jgi:Ca-activated chloride channel family protein